MINSLEFENMINQIEAMAHFGIISIFFEPRSIQLEIYYEKNRQAIRCYRTACLMATQESVHRYLYVFPRLLHTHYNNKISGTHSHDLSL